MRNFIAGHFMPAPGVREIDFGHCVIRLAEPNRGWEEAVSGGRADRISI
jgi:hypothetical protein